MHSVSSIRLVLLACLVLFPASVWADGAAAYIEGGWVPRTGVRTGVGSAGYIFPVQVRGIAGAFSAYGEVFGSVWRTRHDGAHRTNVQVGVIGTLRYRLGQSAWFIDGGAGLTLFNKTYRTLDREFSTTFQFTEVLGVGRSLGPHELALRFQHVSNGGIRNPNPGENLVRLRYVYQF